MTDEEMKALEQRLTPKEAAFVREHERMQKEMRELLGVDKATYAAICNAISEETHD